MMTPRIVIIVQLLLLQMIGISCWATPFYGDDNLQKVDVPVKSMRNLMGMEFVQIPAGEFMMGSDESVDELLKLYGEERNITLNSTIKGLKHSQPSHRVVITKPFYLGKYEVTVGEFKRFVESTGYVPESGKFGGGWGFAKARGHVDQAERFTWHNPGWEQTDAHPVGTVSWNDAVTFCEWLSKTEKRQYRLPTEAEWEYACRAGSKSRFSFGDDPEGLAQFGNVTDGTATERLPARIEFAIKAKDGFVFTAPVGSFRPNPWGLCDMHGNVNEWCSDWTISAKNYYETSEIEDPQGPDAPTSKFWEDRVKVIRGGSWNDGAWSCLCSSRGAQAVAGATSCGCEIGFRVAVGADPTLPPENKADP